MLFSFENLYRQYLACRRNKRNTVNALRFEVGQEENLLALKAALQTRSYSPARSVCFVTRRPKLREIFAADFRDRIVHHVLVAYLERTWEPIFIHDSYACRKGKGVHAGVLRLQQFMRQATANGTRPAWFLQLDIHNYFMSIDKERLFDLLAPRIDDDDALWLTRVLVFHDCTRDYVVKGDPHLLTLVPRHKSLFGTGPGKGLPIGNLNSQFFANVYLNGLDQFVKHELKCRWYLRYCDDFVLLATDRDQLLAWRERIEVFLRERLNLELNDPRQRIAQVSTGVDFLGYIVRRDYLLVRNRVVGHLREQLHVFKRELVATGAMATRYAYDKQVVERLAATVSSYLGHFRLANCYRLCCRLWARYKFLHHYLTLHPRLPKVKRYDDLPGDFRRVGQQYKHFRNQFAHDVVLMQVGGFIEFYAPYRRESVGAQLGLRAMRPTRRGARHGFPLAQLPRRVAKLLAEGKSVAVVCETGRALGRLRERAVKMRLVPASAVSRDALWPSTSGSTSFATLRFAAVSR